MFAHSHGQPQKYDALELIHALTALTPDLESRDIMQRGVDIAQRATGSRIAYLHLLNDDQQSIELGVWSQDTLAHCTARYDRHYPVTSAGIWADTARTRRPCVHNDYAQTPERRGLPEGHSTLVRHLGVPIVDEGAVRLLIGVGNKDTDYDEADVQVLEAVAERIWSSLKQRRIFDAFAGLQSRVQQLQQLARVTTIDYDIDDDRVSCDAVFRSMFRLPLALPAPATMEDVLGCVADGDRLRVRAALTSSDSPRHAWWMHARRNDGSLFLAELKVTFTPRDVGQGVVAHAVLQDLSDRLLLRDVQREQQETEPVTNLPNRIGMARLFKASAGLRAGMGFSLHYVEAGGPGMHATRLNPGRREHVIRTLARRLQQQCRPADIVGALPDGIFMVVQPAVATASDTLDAATRICMALAEPIPLTPADSPVHVWAGSAVTADGTRSLDDVTIAAERSLWRARSERPGTCEVDDLDQ